MAKTKTNNDLSEATDPVIEEIKTENGLPDPKINELSNKLGNLKIAMCDRIRTQARLNQEIPQIEQLIQEVEKELQPLLAK